MGVVRNLLVRVGADFSELQREMASAGRFMKSAGKDLQNIGKGLTVGLTLPIIGIGTAAVKAASDLKEVQNVVDTAFGKSSKEVDKWSKTAIKSYGLSELQAKKFAGTMRAMIGSMGVTATEADKMSMGLSSLAGDMASFYNLDPTEAFDKLRSGISGETEPLKALGINMSVVNMEAYALTKGINKTWKEMSAAEQASLRYNYIMDTTKMAQGDFAKTNTGFANSMRVVKEQLVSVGAQLGGILLPYLETFLGKVRSILDTLQTLSPEMQKTIVKFALIAAAIGPVILILGKLISTTSAVLTWGSGISKALAAVQAGTKGVGAIMTAVFGPAGIVLLVVAGIAALVAGIMYLWKNNEDFRNKVIEIWTNIKNVISGVTGAIKQFLKGNIEDGLESLYETFVDILGEKITNTIVKFAAIIVPILTDTWNKIKDTAITTWNYIKDNIIPTLIKIKDAIVSAFKYAWDTLKPILEGIKDLVIAALELIIAGLRVFVGLLLKIWKTAFDTLKPIVELAFNAIKGFWNIWGSNIIANFKIIWDTVTSIFKGVITIITGLFQAFTGLLTGNWSKTWQGIKNIFIGIWDSMKAVLKAGINFFINGINSMINGVNKIKMPEWVPSIGGKGFSIPKIPMLAKGGIVTKPTLSVIGEGREDEAVLPLSKLNNLLDLNNKKEISAPVQTFPKDINIKLTMPNGKVLAEITAPFLDTIQGKSVVLAGRGVGI